MVSTDNITPLKPSSRHRRFHVNSDLRLAFLFILPAVLLVGILMYYPMARAFNESLYKTPKTAWLNPDAKQIYVGLDHYKKLVNDEVFKQILKNSLRWTIGVVLFQNIIGLLTAVLLEKKSCRGAASCARWCCCPGCCRAW